MEVMKHAAFAILLVFLSLRIANAQQNNRWFHRAALVDDTLYVYGGEIEYNASNYTGEILALDVTKNFSTRNVPWNGRLESGIPVASHSLTVGGQDNRFLISYGGISANGAARDVAVFDTRENSWSTWDRAEVSVDVMKHTAVSLPNTSTMYVFGGYPVGSNTTERNTLIEVDTLDERSEDTSRGPFKRIQHTATMLDGNMYVIGGDTNEKPVSMAEIYVYNTRTDKWTRQTARGDIPSPRRSHQAVAWGRDIIMFGGDNVFYNSSADRLAVLNVDTMTWSKPSTKGIPPHARSGHSMTMVGSNAIITFGFYLGIESEEANVFVLDVENYTWTTHYVPNSRTPPSPSEQTNGTTDATTDDKKSGDNIPIIVVAVLASAVVVTVVGVLVVKFLRRRAYWRNTLSEFSISKDISKANISNETSAPDSGGVGVTQSLQSPYHSHVQPLPNDSPQTMVQPYQHYTASDVGGVPYAYPVQSPSSIPEGYAMAGQSPHMSGHQSSYDSATVLLSGAHVAHGTYSMTVQGAHDSVLREAYDQGAHDVVAVQGAPIMMTPGAPMMQEAPNMMTQEVPSMMTKQEAPSMVTQEAQNIAAQGVNDVNAQEPSVPRSSSPPTSEVVELNNADTGHRDLKSTDGTGNP